MRAQGTIGTKKATRINEGETLNGKAIYHALCHLIRG